MNAILDYHGDRVFATLQEFREATSIGAVDYHLPADVPCTLCAVRTT
jgi:hypothetical protein